jgi:hypothetical protein
MAEAGRRLFNDDVAALLGIDRHSVNWLNYQANRRRREGRPKPGDMPEAAGRELRPVPSSLGWDVLIEKPWWWEADIAAWLPRRAEARKAAWNRPHGERGEFISAAGAEAS